MRLSRVTSRVSLAFLLSATLVSPGLYAQAALTAPAPIPLAKPESVGFSSEALAKMDEGMQAIVDKKHLSGVVTLVASGRRARPVSSLLDGEAAGTMVWSRRRPQHLGHLGIEP